MEDPEKFKYLFDSLEPENEKLIEPFESNLS